MAATTKQNIVCLFDDEPHNLQYIIDYLASKGLRIIVEKTADDALMLLETEIYRALIIDLNIPISTKLAVQASHSGILYVKYPGLYVAEVARNKGYRGRQTIIYSVHRDKSILPEVKKLSLTYMIKGRPKEIKNELDDVIGFDPTLKDTLT